jgi:hypothetical protein
MYFLPILIMHYLTYVFIPPEGDDVASAVATALRPFHVDFSAMPWKEYLRPGEIAAMAKSLRLRRSAVHQLAARMHEWNGCLGAVDAKGLFAIRTGNLYARFDWYEIGGRYDQAIPGNVATARELRGPKRTACRLPHDFLTPDGVWHSRTRFLPSDWGQGRFVRTREGRWRAQFTVALQTFPNHRVVCVDRHC